jgi:hypothetical protein
MSAACEACDMGTITNYLENVTNVEVSEEEVNNAAVEIMNALQADACVYESEVDVGEAVDFESGCQAGVGWTGAGASCHASYESEDIDLGDNVTAIGCETITLNATKYAQTKKTMVNVLSCNCQTIDSNVTLQNKLVLNMTDVQCSAEDMAALQVSQLISANIKVVNELSAEQEVAIDSLMDTFLQSTVDSITKEIANTASQTDMNVTTVEQEIVEENIANSVSVGINAMKSEILAQNEGIINITGSSFVGGCHFTQDILLDVIVTNALSSSLKTILETDTLAQALTDLTYTHEEIEGEKGPTIFDNEDNPFGTAPGVGSGFGFDISGAGGWIMFIICCICCMCCILFVISSNIS